MVAYTERIRVSFRSVAFAVAALGLTLLALRVLESAGRVIGWVAIAASAASLVGTVAVWLSRRMPYGAAVAAVMLASLAAIGGVVYGVVDEVVAQLAVLEREAPQLAAEFETSDRFGDVAREIDLAERTERFVGEVPERLRGGTPAEAIRAATTRGLAFLAVTVLTVFFLLHGRDLANGALRQIHDDDRRREVERVLFAAHRRAFDYARGAVLQSAAAGLVAWALAAAADVPGPTPLALWVALWDLVPVVGAAVGAVPIVGLAFAIEPAWGITLAIAFVAYQVFENRVLQRHVERTSVRVGPFLTVAAGMAGVELYGIAGALIAIVAVAFVASVAQEVEDGMRGAAGG